jgi:Ni,Fe-hydrogenase I cytochrome b subunit
MNFPMSMSDISLWLAVMAIILLITSEFISSATEYSRNIVIEKNRLRLVALALGIGFMATVVMRIFQPF